ncbi:PucR family transcriptional regulator [Thermomonospora catenispora]|uniref:PucR family transcriptional regulator n=1 Tax=Thermomonospora catenispora TaxID=2493090 RepID=UPI00111F12CC|nr:helix-turn-helix domain-containing protein [Thermomonospora catenispora]TNY36967.1 PucR family transcriptional regulator [Thermomonospora catenispora]
MSSPQHSQTLEPWVAVPGEIADLCRPLLGEVAEEMIEEIQRGVPEYARPLDEEYARMVRLAVEGAVRQFIDLIGDPDASWEQVTAVYRDIGLAEAREGRSLDALQTALRLGARVAWRRLALEAERHNVSRRVLSRLAEAIFAFLDEIAAAATAGYNEARSQAAGELEHRRRRLLDLVLSDPPASPQAIAELARTARWQVPQTVAAVALAERGEQRFAHPALPPDVLADVNRREPCLVVPDPDGPGRYRMLENGLREWTAAVGPTVRVEEAAKSLRWAREALALARRGVLPADRPVRCVDHMPTLVMFKDEDLIRLVGERRLAPLQQVRPRHRERLARTLLACLQSGFNATEVASRLHVHPQTVRYRLHQLEQLFGEELYDPDIRLELEMVLQVHLFRLAEKDGRADVIALKDPRRSAPPPPIAAASRS